MLLNLTELTDESLQSQIVRQVRAKILSAELSAGSALPSIRALAREQQVSVITVQRAYERLEREGLIRSRSRRGFFVSESSLEDRSHMAKAQFTERLQPVILAARAEGLTAEDILLIVKRTVEEDVATRRGRI